MAAYHPPIASGVRHKSDVYPSDHLTETCCDTQHVHLVSPSLMIRVRAAKSNYTFLPLP